MAVLNSTLVSLMDVTKRLNPTGSVESDIAELLTQNNEIIQDLVWREGNLSTGHRVTIRTGLPTSKWRRFNEGVPNSKSTTIQVDEACAMLEQKGSVDKDLAMLNGNTAEFRLSENIPHIDQMNIDFATALFYADSSTPEKFLGLSPRYSALTGFANSQNIITASGAGTDNTSIWLLGHGEKGIYGIYPKGSVGGLQHTVVKDGTGDGCTEVDDGTGATYRAFVDRYQWKCGIVVKDWRYAVRICNIDVSNLVGESSAADIIKLMSRAIDRIPSAIGVKLAFYMNRTVFSMLKIQALNKSLNALSIEDALLQFGDHTVKAKVMNFLGIPIRICDALNLAESLVS